MKPKITKYDGPDATNSYCAVLTPEVVDELLRINISNRKMQQSNLSMFDSIVKNEDWSVGAVVIRVNSSWTRLIDGQHKLTALKNNNYPQVAATIIEVPDEYAEEAFLNTDIGCIRTVSQVMKIASVDYEAKLWAAIDRGVNRFVKDPFYKSSAATVERSHEMWEHILKDAGISSSGDKFANSGAISALIVFCIKEEGLAMAAIDGYKSAKEGVMLAADDPRLLLNRFLMGSFGNKPNVIFFKCLKAIWSYTHDVKMRFLRIEDKDVEFFANRYNLTIKSLKSRAS